MAGTATAKFHNDMGVEKIEIGTKEFECIGATPPFDHPHIYLDMGTSDEVVCPYCSTHYVYNTDLKAHNSVPPEAALAS